MRITKRQLRRLIREAIGPGPAATGIKSAPSGQVAVDWDFTLDGDETGWNEMAYEDQEASEGLPPVFVIPPDVMAEYHAIAGEYGDSQAEQIITDWLSDETGWLHEGWSWV